MLYFNSTNGFSSYSRTASSPKIVVIFIMCLWVLNICYLMVIKLVCPNRFDSVRRQPPGFRRVSVWGDTRPGHEKKTAVP